MKRSCKLGISTPLPEEVFKRILDLYLYITRVLCAWYLMLAAMDAGSPRACAISCSCTWPLGDFVNSLPLWQFEELEVSFFRENVATCLILYLTAACWWLVWDHEWHKHNINFLSYLNTIGSKYDRSISLRSLMHTFRFLSHNHYCPCPIS